MNWLRRKELPPPPIDVPTDFPSGLFVDTGSGKYYIKGNTKFKAFSDRTFYSWSPPYVVEATPEALSKFLMGPPLGFRNGTLIHNVADAKMYLISASERRHIVSPDVFNKYGLDESTMIKVSDAEARLHKEGEPLE